MVTSITSLLGHCSILYRDFPGSQIKKMGHHGGTEARSTQSVALRIKLISNFRFEDVDCAPPNLTFAICILQFAMLVLRASVISLHCELAVGAWRGNAIRHRLPPEDQVMLDLASVHMRKSLFPPLVIAVAICAAQTAGADRTPLQQAQSSITKEALLRHIEVLSSDDFEGRAPGTAGERKTVDYLINQFKQAGLAPGNPDGGYIQKVPLVGFTAQPTVAFSSDGKQL